MSIVDTGHKHFTGQVYTSGLLSQVAIGTGGIAHVQVLAFADGNGLGPGHGGVQSVYPTISQNGGGGGQRLRCIDASFCGLIAAEK